jgi:G6PDH family F420-dependent oxidoreductase
VLVSGFGPKAISLAAKIGDGYVTMSPDADAIAQYRSEGGRGPVHSGTKVCYMASAAQARETVMRLWPNEALPGELAQVLPTPAHFEQACELVTPDRLMTPLGPDIEAHIDSLRQYEQAGVDELYVQQVGPEKDAFFGGWAVQVLDAFSD